MSNQGPINRRVLIRLALLGVTIVIVTVCALHLPGLWPQDVVVIAMNDDAPQTSHAISSEQLKSFSSQAAYASAPPNPRFHSATLTLASFEESLEEVAEGDAALDRTAFVSEVCADVDALIDEDRQSSIVSPQAAAILGEAQSDFRADKLPEGAAKLVEVLDAFPRTDASKISNRALSALQELAQKGKISQEEAEKFAALLPSWSECTSAEGKYLLLDFARTRADAAKVLGNKSAEEVYNQETRAAAYQLILEHPESPIQIDVPMLYYESSAKLGAEEAAGAAEDLQTFIESSPESMARWASRSVLAMHLQRADHDLERARIQQINFLAESDKPFVKDVLADDKVYDWVKALIDYEIGKAMFNLGRRPEAIKQFEGVVANFPEGGWPTMLSAYMRAFVVDQDNYQSPDKGITAFDEFLAKFPDSAFAPKAMWNLASVYFRESDFANAAPLFQEVAKRWPGTNEAVASEDTINYMVTYNYLPSQLVSSREKGRQPTDLIRMAQVCGPMALQKLLERRGVSATIQELATLAGTDGSGTSMLGLVQAAKQKGTDLIGVETESLQSLKPPFIAFVNGNHFVTVVEITDDVVVVEDMNEPQSKVPVNEFISKWNKQALVVRQSTEPLGTIQVAQMENIRGGSTPDPPAEPSEGGLPTQCPNQHDPGECDKDTVGTASGHGGAGFPTDLPKIDLFSNGIIGGDLADAISFATLPIPSLPGAPPSLISPKASSTTGVDIPGVHLRIVGYQGAVTLHERDIDVPVRGPLRLVFRRDYRNPWGYHRAPLSKQQYPWQNAVGASWTHNHHVVIQVSAASQSNGAPTSVLVRDDAGNLTSYIYTSRVGTTDNYAFDGDVLTWARGSAVTRDTTTGKFLYALPSGLTYRFFAPVTANPDLIVARPEYLSDTSGNTLTYEYDGSNMLTARLIKIHAPSGDDRYIQFNYGANGLFSTVQLKSGSTVLQSVTYGYTQDPASTWYELTSVTDNGGEVVSYEYSSSLSPDPQAPAGTMIGRYISSITDKEDNEYLIQTDHKMHPTYGPQAYVVSLTYPTGLKTTYDRAVVGTGHSDVTILNRDSVAQADLSKFRIVAGPHGYRPAKYVFYPTPGASTGNEWIYEYDNMDLITIKDPSGATFAGYTYTDKGRLASAAVNGASATTYTYPTGGTLQSNLYPVQKTVGGVDTYFEYDTNLRLTQVYGPGTSAASSVLSTDKASIVGASSLVAQRGPSSDFSFDNFKRTSYPSVYVEDFADGVAQGWSGSSYTVTSGYMNLTGGSNLASTEVDTDLWFSYYLDADGTTDPIIVHPRYDLPSYNRVQLMIYAGEMRLSQTVNGVTTNFQNNTAVDTALDTWYNVHIKCNGSTVQVYWGQQGQTLPLVLSTSACTVNATDQVSIYVGSGDVLRLDNFLITKPGTGTAAFSDNFDDGNYAGWTVGSGAWDAASKYLRSAPSGSAANISTGQTNPEGKLSFSYRVDSTDPSAYGTVYFRYNADGSDGLCLIVYPNKMELLQKTGSTWTTLASNTNATSEQGRWYDVDITYRGYQVDVARSAGYKLVYDQYGQVTTAKDGNGNQWTFEYDSSGNVTSKINPDGDEVVFTYDGFGNVLSETLNDVLVADYDYLNPSYPEHMSLKTYPDGATEEYNLTPQGQLGEVINTEPDGFSFSQVYDYNELQKPTATTLNSESGTVLTYNRLGQILSQRLCVGGADTTFAYDHYGRLTERVFDNGHEEHFVYDTSGMVVEVRDENDQIITDAPDPYDILSCYSSVKTPANPISADLLEVSASAESCVSKCTCGCATGGECKCNGNYCSTNKIYALYAVAFGNSTSAYIEGNLDKQVAVYRFPGRIAAVPTTVFYEVDGTATGGGEDHTLEEGMHEIVFPPFSAKQNIAIGILDDIKNEANETIELTLDTADNAMIVAPDTHTMTIHDDDPEPTVTFDAPASSVLEGDTILVKVNVDPPTGRTVTIPYTIDVSPSDRVTIEPSELSISDAGSGEFQISVSENEILDQQEIFNITLLDPAYATLGPPEEITHHVTIDDNKVVLSVTPILYGEGEIFRTPPGVQIDQNAQYKYTLGEHVRLEAQPVAGFFFDRWTGDHTGTDPIVDNVVMNANKHVSARFYTTFDLITDESSDSTGTGTITPSGAGLRTPDPEIGYLQINAAAEADCRWVRWTEGIPTGAGNPADLYVDRVPGQTVTIKAKFNRQYQLTLLDPEHGNIAIDSVAGEDQNQIDPAGRYDAGTLITVKVTQLESGYLFAHWLTGPDANNLLPTMHPDAFPNTYFTFLMNGDMTLSAHFGAPIVVNPLIHPENAGWVQLLTEGYGINADVYPEGGYGDFNVVANYGHEFDHWEAYGSTTPLLDVLITPTINADLEAYFNRTIPTADFVARPLGTPTGTPPVGTAPLEIQFNDLSLPNAANITTWEWDFGDSCPVGSVQHPMHTYRFPGIYTVSLTAHNIFGDGTKTRTGYIVVNGGLVARWPFDEDSGLEAMDAGPYGLDLTLTDGQTTQGAAGIVDDPAVSEDYALQIFPGAPPAAVADYIDTGDPDACGDTRSPLDLTSEATFMTWFKLAGSGANQTILSKRDAIETSETGYEIVLNPTGHPNQVMLRYGDGEGVAQGMVSVYSDTFNFNDGEWHHLGIVFDETVSNTITFYLDGAPNGSSPIDSEPIAANNANLKVGANGDNDNHLNGYLDELIIQQKALATSEIEDEFERVQHLLTVERDHESAGGVSILTEVEDGVLMHGETVTLTPEPVSGAQFIRWEGVPITQAHDNPLNINMYGDRTIRALFAKAQFEFEVDNVGVQFTNTSLFPSSLDITWHWDFGDGNSDEDVSPTHTYDSAGVRQVTLTMDIAGENTDPEASHEVTVGPGPTAAILVEYLKTTKPYEVRLTDISTALDQQQINDWTWTFTEGNPELIAGAAVGPQITLRYPGSGKFEVKLRVEQDDDQNSDTAKVDVILKEAPTAEFAIAPDGDKFINHYITFTDQSTPGDGEVLEWRWDFGDNTTATAKGPHRHVYTLPNAYNVTLFVRNEFGSDTKTVGVPINAVPAASPDFIVESVTGITAGQQFKLGDTITVSTTIENEGTGGSPPGRKDVLYLSLDQVPDVNDLQLISRSGAAIAPDETDPYTFYAVTLPDIAPGRYYLIVSANDDHAITEIKDTNNTDDVAITVVDPEMSNE